MMMKETLQQYLDERESHLLLDSDFCRGTLSIPRLVSSLLEVLISFDRELLTPIVEKIREQDPLPEDIAQIVYRQIKDKFFLPLSVFSDAPPTSYHRHLARLITQANVKRIVTLDVDDRLEKALIEQGLRSEQDFVTLKDKDDWQSWQEHASVLTISKLYGCVTRPESLQQAIQTRESGLGVFQAQALQDCFSRSALYFFLHNWQPYLHMFILESHPPSCPGFLCIGDNCVERHRNIVTEYDNNLELKVVSREKAIGEICRLDPEEIEQNDLTQQFSLDPWKKELGAFEAYQVIGDLASFVDEEQMAISCRKKAEQVAKSQMYPNNISHSLMKLGESYGNIGRSIEAQAFFEKALEISQRLQNQRLTATVYTHLGNMYREKSNPVLSVKHYQRSIKIYEESGLWDEAADIYLKCGELYEMKGILGEAIKAYEHGLKLYQQTGNVSLIGRTSNYLGRVYFQKTDWSQAKEHYQKGLDLAFACGDIVSIARIYSNLGVLAQQYPISVSTSGPDSSRHRNLEDSLYYYKRARRIFQQIRDKSGLATVEHNLALVAP